MRLKRLEMVGFQSLAQRTVDEMNPGITAVVGPDGCRKSNIVDALRWAMGEQSARHIRGHQMEKRLAGRLAEKLRIEGGREGLPPPPPKEGEALLRRGYDIVPINPQAQEIEGRRCFPQVREVTPAVEAVLLMTPPRVTEAVVRILGAIPGLTLVDLEQPRVGYMCNSLAPVAAYKRELQARELAAAAAAGVDCLVGVYHACHRELCAHETSYPFRIVNFLELLGEAMGIDRPDLFKQWKMMQDVDRVLADTAGQIVAAGLDVDAVREVMLTAILGEQPLPLGRPTR